MYSGMIDDNYAHDTNSQQYFSLSLFFKTLRTSASNGCI